MDIEKIRLFISVAQTLSFTKASEQMYISQPTLSRYISEMEDTMGAQLFVRTTRKVSLTPVGKQFLHEAIKIITKYDSVMDHIGRLGKGFSGVLNVGYLELFTQDILPTAIKRFRQKYPLVEIHLRELTLVETYSALENGEIDVGFIMSHGQPSTVQRLHTARIITGELELIVSNDHPLSQYKIVSPTVLKNDPILTFEQMETPHLKKSIMKLCIEHGFVPNLREEDFSPGAIFLLVQAGVGVSLLSSLITSVLRNETKFHTLKLEGIHIPTNLDLVWCEDNLNLCIPNFLAEIQEAAHPVEDLL